MSQFTTDAATSTAGTLLGIGRKSRPLARISFSAPNIEEKLATRLSAGRLCRSLQYCNTAQQDLEPFS